MPGKVKILAIDDEAKALSLFKLNMESYGYEVLATTSSKAGILLAINEKPDLIILDIRMPEMDGWQICKKLKLNSVTNQIPVIFFTACSSSKAKEEAKRLGVYAYLIKPVDPDIVAELIKKVAADTGTYIKGEDQR